MSAASLTPASAGREIPSLLASHAVVALVSAGADGAWAARAAWTLARAAAAAGRRTALVDCVVDEPTLHEVVGAPNDTGIVDAFEYGASLTRIAQQQDDPNLYFIPGGTFAANPDAVLSHARWKRLSAGFRHEDALLLLFVAAGGAATLAADLDGMVVLGEPPDGSPPAELPGVKQLLSRGVDLVAVVAEAAPAAPLAATATPAAPSSAPAPAPAPPAHPTRPTPHRRPSAPMAALVQQQKQGASWAVWAAVLVLAAGGAGWLYRDRLMELVGVSDAPADTAAAPAPAPPPVDSLSWALQLAAWPDTTASFAQADSVESLGLPVAVTPVELRGRLWYRVHLGPAASDSAARAMLARLRLAGYTAAGASQPARLPLSLALRSGFTPNQAQLARAHLRRSGVGAFVLGRADGRYALFAGLFADSSEAPVLRRLLPPTDSAAGLGPRVGFLP